MQDFLYFFVELQQNMYDISYMNDLLKFSKKHTIWSCKASPCVVTYRWEMIGHFLYATQNKGIK